MQALINHRTVSIVLALVVSIATATEMVPLRQPDGASPLAKIMAQRKPPAIKFDHASLSQAVSALGALVNKPDGHEPSPWVNIILQLGTLPSMAEITLDLKDVPAKEALTYITELSGAKADYETHAIIVRPDIICNVPVLLTRSYLVNARFAEDPARAASPQKAMKAAGISFVESESAIYDPSATTLTVRKSSSNIEAVEQWLVSIKAWSPPPPPPAVALAAKLMIHEINFHNASLKDTVAYLQSQSRKAPPLAIDYLPNPELEKSRITLNVREVSVLDILRYAAAITGCALEADESKLVLKPY